MKKAVIDLGSNTIRLSIYEISGGSFSRIFTQKVTAGLAGYVRQGVLAREGIRAAVNALESLRQAAEAQGVQYVNVFATAALRNAENSKEAKEEIEAHFGQSIEVLGGEEEAALSFMGARSDFPEEDGIMFDVGGGSTELLSFRGERVLAAKSIAMGCLSLFSEFVSGVFSNYVEREAMRRAIEQRLSCAGFGEKSPSLLGVGGSVRALDALADELLDKRHKRGVLTAGELNELERLLAGDAAAQEAAVRRFPERARTILPGAMIIVGIMREAGGKRVYVSDCGVREGYVISRLISGAVPNAANVIE